MKADEYLDLRLGDFLDRLGAGKPAPGSGSASALTVAIAAGLVAMVARKSEDSGTSLRASPHRRWRCRRGPRRSRSPTRRSGTTLSRRWPRRATTPRRRTVSSRRSSTFPQPSRSRSRRRLPTRRRSPRWRPSSGKARTGPTPPQPPCWRLPVHGRLPISWPSTSRCRRVTSGSPAPARARRRRPMRRRAHSTPGADRCLMSIVVCAHGCGAGPALPCRRSRRLERARRAVLPLRVRDLHAGLPADSGRRGGRLPGGVHARLHPARLPARRQRAAAVDRAADAPPVPRLDRRLGSHPAGEPTSSRTTASAPSTRWTRRSSCARRSPSCPSRARRCSTASSPATRATGRSREELDLPSGTIASRISRCLRRLRVELEGKK